jgi:uncharacterized protein with PIN domain
VIVLDAYALTALLVDEPGADEVGQLIAEGGTVVAVPNLAEAADRLDRIHGIAVNRTRTAVESLEQSADLQARSAEPGHAWRAAELRANHYRRSERPLSLGDCLLLAMTGDGDRLATSDPHVLDVAAEEQIGWIALADSEGHRHEPKP